MTEKRQVVVLSKEKIFGSALREEVVEVPGWGGKVLIRELTKQQEDWCRQQPDLEFESAVFQTGIVEPIFTREEVTLVKGKGAAAFNTIVRAILDLSGVELKA